MNDRLIDFDPLIEGVLIKRYKRFLADIELESGEVVTAHCANTGPMLSLIHISEPTRRTPISYAVFCLKKNYFLKMNALGFV